jgi:hypothetical protein
MAKMLVKNLRDYSVVAFSWNDKFHSVSFEPNEVKDLSGIQINTVDNFRLFVKDYIKTNILTLIPIYDDFYVAPVLEDGYFDFAYVDYDWVD